MPEQLQKATHHTVPELNKSLYIADYLPGIFPSLTTKSAVKKALKKKLLFVNGKIAQTSTQLSGGETVLLHHDIAKAKKPDIKLKLEVLFEDEYLAIVNKPAGITVSGNAHYTLENALSGNLKKSSEPDGLTNPEPVHRLDKPTSGLLVVAKTKSALVQLNGLFENKEILKKYRAITIGTMLSEGQIDHPIEEKDCLSEYRVLKSVESERFGRLNLVELNPKTGRKHQLRIHMLHIGNPILGDWEHGKEGLILKGKGLYLHAFSIEFVHPVTKQKLQVKSAMPGKFNKILPNQDL